MTTLVYLIPIALFLGAISLIAFLWALRSGQYEDLDGAAERILLDEEQRPVRRAGPSDISVAQQRRHRHQPPGQDSGK